MHIYVCISALLLHVPLGLGVDCGSEQRTYTLCGSDHTVIKNETSIFYQLSDAPIRLRPPQTAPSTGGSIISNWWTNNEKVVSTNPKDQVHKSFEDLIINPMNDAVNDTQYKYVLQSVNGTRLTIVYETEWSTVRLGKNATVKVDDQMFTVRIKESINIPVTGLPLPAVELKNSATTVGIDRCQLKGDMLELGPVELSDHDVTYTLTASNCFNSITASFTIDVLTPPSTDSVDTNVNATCNEAAIMQCNGSGNPQPNITWTFTPIDGRQHFIVTASVPTPLGGIKYQSVLTVSNVQVRDEGAYECLVDNGIGDAVKVIYTLSLECIPDPPVVNILSITDDTIRYDITPPTYTGGLPIRYYTVYFNKRERHLNVTTDPVEDSISQLDPKTVVMFNVRAHNDIGSSNATVVSYMTDGPFDYANISDLSSTCYSVTFTVSANETGVSPPLNYTIIYILSGGSSENFTQESPVVNQKLQEGKDYTIKVIAENTYGLSGASSYELSLSVCRKSNNVLAIVLGTVGGALGLGGSFICICFCLHNKNGRKRGVFICFRVRKKNVSSECGDMKNDYADSGPKEEQSASYAVPDVHGQTTTKTKPKMGPTESQKDPDGTKTAPIVEKAPKASKLQQQTKDVYTQPHKPKKKTDSAPIELYAQPAKSNKQKKGQEEYAQVDKDRKKQNPGLQYADLDPSAMERSTATRAETGVQYSKVNAAQLPPRSE